MQIFAWVDIVLCVCVCVCVCGSLLTGVLQFYSQGDIYESTVDVLYHLYDKLSIGGYVIMDDWFDYFPSKTACEDFFAVHGIKPEIIPIDKFAAYWKKTEDVQVQYWRYEQSNFTS